MNNHKLKIGSGVLGLLLLSELVSGCANSSEGKESYWGELSKKLSMIVMTYKQGDTCYAELEVPGSPKLPYGTKEGTSTTLLSPKNTDVRLICTKDQEPTIVGLPRVTSDQFQKYRDNMQPYAAYCADARNGDPIPERQEVAVKNFC